MVSCYNINTITRHGAVNCTNAIMCTFLFMLLQRVNPMEAAVSLVSEERFGLLGLQVIAMLI